MSKDLNDQEKLNLMQLTDAYIRLADKYTDEDSAPAHSPHAVATFAHEFFHDIFERELIERTKEMVEAQAYSEVDGMEVAIAPFNLEELVRKTYEMILLTGIEFGRLGYIVAPCECVEKIGDVVETQLREGGCGHA